MFHMKTASVRELRQDFPRILAWLQAGEKVTITLRRQAVATLVPRRPRKKSKRPMPDLTARLQKVFGKRVISERTIAAILEQNRSEF